jgi:serine/threonine protein kinase
VIDPDDPEIAATLEERDAGVAKTRPSAPLARDSISGIKARPEVSARRYELGAEIARGGMGRVVEATDTLLGRTVAIKEVLALVSWFDPAGYRSASR